MAPSSIGKLLPSQGDETGSIPVGATRFYLLLPIPLTVRDPALNRSTEVRILDGHPFPDRLTVGQQTLTLFVLVRIQFGDPSSKVCRTGHTLQSP